MDRRRYLQLVTAGGMLGIAGCTGDGGGSGNGGGAEDTTTATAMTDETTEGTSTISDRDPTTTPSSTTTETTTEETSTPAVVQAVVGERVGSDNVSMVVRATRRANRLGEYSTPDEGNEFLIVRLAVKNTATDSFVEFSSLLQTRVTDDQGYTYRQAVSTGDEVRPFVGGQLAPGEVTRGDMVFEVPTGASGLSLEFDFELVDFVDLKRAVVDLSTERSTINDLSQSLEIRINEQGDQVTDAGTAVTLNSVETATSLGRYTEADSGNEYVILDVSVTNDTGEAQSVSIALQMQLKDGKGFAYSIDLGAYSALTQAFPQGSEIADGQTRRGKIAYQVPKGTAPLFWTFEFSLFTTGDKSFWKVR